MAVQRNPVLPRDKKTGKTITKPVKKPVKPNKNDPNSFADADYWDQLNALLQNADSYRNNMDLQKSRIGTDFGDTTQELAKNRGRDLTSIREDFAGRGMVKSGAYGGRVNQYETDYNDSLADLARARDRSLQDISMGYNNYLEQWRLQKKQAINDAIQRKLLKMKK